MTLTDIKRPQAIAAFSTYLVYQVLGVSVSRDTLCLMTPLTALEDESMPVWDVGRRARTDGRGTRSDWLGTKPQYTQRAVRAVRWGTKCPSAQTLERFSSLIVAWIRTRKGDAKSMTPEQATPGMRVRVKEHHRVEERRGLMGTVVARYGGEEQYVAVDVRLADGQYRLFWVRDPEEISSSPRAS